MLSVRELNDPTIIQERRYPITVMMEGLNFADNICSVESLDPTIGDTDGDGIPDDDEEFVEGESDIVTNGLNTVGDWTGLTKLTLWLILMVFVGIAIMIDIARYNGQGITSSIIAGHIMVVAFLEVLLLIVGYKLKYIPNYIFISIIIAIVVIAGVGIAKFISSASSGGG